MKIFIAGGTGRVATELIKNLIKDGHEVIAGSRKPENLTGSSQVTAVKLDLHEDADEIAKIIGDVDAVYFTAGSRGSDLLQTDAFGAVKVMQAAEMNHVSRFVMLSSVISLEPKEWHQKGLDSIPDYNIAKFFADNYLISNTKLAYTILQPTSLVEEPGTGKITIDEGKIATNSIPNVGLVLADIIKFDNTIGKVIKMHDGDTAIDTALKQVK